MESGERRHLGSVPRSEGSEAGSLPGSLGEEEVLRTCNARAWGDIYEVMAGTVDGSGGAPAPAERFTALFHGHYQQVVRFAQRRIGVNAAQEIAAETFLVAWHRLGEAPDPALPWLYRIALYAMANHRRRSARYLRTDVLACDLQKPLPEPEEAALGRQAAVTALLALGEADQEILRQTAWDGLSAAEGARVLGCSVTTYRVRLHRARQRFEHHYQAALEDEPDATLSAQDGSLGHLRGPSEPISAHTKERNP